MSILPLRERLARARAYFMSNLKRKIFYFSILILFNSQASAFKYYEHKSISEQAYNAACSEIKKYASQNPSYSTLCNNQYLRQCYAHFVAIGGDVLRDADAFNEKPTFLRGRAGRGEKVLDCSNTVYSLFFDYPTLPERLPDTLGPSFKRNLSIAINASINEKHFMPFAEKEFQSINANLAQNENNLTYASFTQHALAMHYLQDAYSAGHNGVKRESKHDYDHAYHDDLNHYGLFLTDGQSNQWFTYGDGRLDENIYILNDFKSLNSKEELQEVMLAVIRHYGMVNKESTPRSSESTLAKQGKQYPLSDTELDQIWGSYVQAKHNDILSIPLLSGNGLFNICFYSDGCNKLEVLLSENRSYCEGGVTLLKTAESTLTVCPGATERIVSASTAHLKNLFVSILSSLDSRSQNTLIKEVYFPIGYKTVNSTISGRGINKVPLIVFYDQNFKLYPQDLTKFRPRVLSFSNWGVAFSDRLSANELRAKQALFWTLRLTSKPDNEPSKHIYNSGRVEVRWEVINDESRAFDRVDSSFFTPRFRSKNVFNNVLGMNLKATLGVENIWEESSRNIFAGVGVGLDIHLGKNTFFIELERSRHYHSSNDDYYSTQAVVGWRSTSIDLSTPINRP